MATSLLSATLPDGAALARLGKERVQQGRSLGAIVPLARSLAVDPDYEAVIKRKARWGEEVERRGL